MASSATSIARSRKAALCPRRCGGPTMRNRKSAPVSSMCSLSKRIGWDYSSELSGSPERRSRLEWPISSTTSSASSSCARSPSHDRLVLPQRDPFDSLPNCDQTKSIAGLRGPLPAENTSLIELSSLAFQCFSELEDDLPEMLSFLHVADCGNG